ncbi:protein kinase [Streptomyces sp. NPDC102274]|uniref:protein kinase domain-containing protein n=1 Tax=Streptomyces sp. NPDC102274 TaxID=3366151 RepID=UPI0037FB5D30
MSGARAVASVTLSVRSGPSEGRKFSFEERATCVVGRASDCSPRLPQDDMRVSRHHCLFDINPPDVRVRDFGSLNGTFVNGEEIGRREPDETPEQAARVEFPERDLAHGDEVRMGETLLRVEIAAEAAAGEPVTTRAYCAHCGRDVEPADRDRADRADRGRAGDIVCDPCRNSPRTIVRGLLSRAAEDDGLAGLRDYELVRELGRGGQGVVHLARHLGTGELVALKVLLAEIAVGHRARANFLREIEGIRGLRHRNIVGFHDSGSHGASFYLACEYCGGGDLGQWLAARGGTLPPDEAVAIASQVLDGLAHAHTAPLPRPHPSAPPAPSAEGGGAGSVRGLVHRDIKPSNILLTADGTPPTVKISDFGLAKAFDRAGLSGLTRTGTVAGTVAYMPRTQVVDYKYAKPEVDVWATAATLYRMLTGATPRDFPPTVDPLAVLLREPAVPIRDRSPSVPRRLARVIDEALIDSPRIVTTTADSFRKALEEAV